MFKKWRGAYQESPSPCIHVVMKLFQCANLFATLRSLHHAGASDFDSVLTHSRIT